MANSNAFMDWMAENPEARNMGVGFLKSMEDRKKSDALAGAEVAKTQYGHLTGMRGDVSKQPKSSLDRMLQGYISGAAERQDGEFNKAILDKLQDKKGRVNPKIRPTETLSQAQFNENPEHPISFTPEKQGLSQQVKAAMQAREALGGTQEGQLFKQPNEVPMDTEIPTAFTQPNALDVFTRTEMTDAEKDEASAMLRMKELKDRQTATPFGFAHRG